MCGGSVGGLATGGLSLIGGATKAAVGGLKAVGGLLAPDIPEAPAAPAKLPEAAKTPTQMVIVLE